MGSPPPPGSKKLVFTLRSVSSMVIAPASTGRDNNSNRAVINTLHTNKGTRIQLCSLLRMLIIVVIKLIAPKIEEAPARCSEKIAKSTEGPVCAIECDKGGYTVHPVPAPCSTRLEVKSKIREGGSNQNLILFKRGKAISGKPIIRGIRILPKPPIIIGITMKKIIIKA